ncbi:MAG: hypothetical protein ACRDBI_01625 [Shewanella sp.]
MLQQKLQQKIAFKSLALRLWPSPERLRALMIYSLTLAGFSLGSLTALATEPSLSSLAQPKETKPLPLGTLLDNQGRPLSLPQHSHSALEYSAPIASPEANTPSTATTKRTTAKLSTSKQSTSKRSAEAKLLSSQRIGDGHINRERIANDPNCRWLDNRLTQLESLTRGQRGNPAQYHAEELHARQQEWLCLKCGAAGPVQGDYGRCQYRRASTSKLTD